MLKTIVLLLTISMGFIGIAYYDTNTIEIRHYEIENSPLGKVLDGVKVAFLSDLHIKSIGLRENRILTILKEEKPDFILLAGDYINYKNSYESATNFFQQLKSTHGVYGVLGNMEYSNENGSCILCHSVKSRKLKDNPNPTILRNSAIPLKLNSKVLNLIGLDDPVGKKGDLKEALKYCEPNIPSVLLSHSPEVLKKQLKGVLILYFVATTMEGSFF